MESPQPVNLRVWVIFTSMGVYGECLLAGFLLGGILMLQLLMKTRLNTSLSYSSLFDPITLCLNVT
jgi:hypothetical protein